MDRDTRAVRDSRATLDCRGTRGCARYGVRWSYRFRSDPPRPGTRESRYLRGGRRTCRGGWTSSRLSRGHESARCSHRVPNAALGGTHGRCDRLRTSLDTWRLRGELSSICRVHPAAVHAWVVGEHGDSAVLLFSSATIAGLTLDEFARQTGVDLSVERLATIAETVRGGQLMANTWQGHFRTQHRRCRLGRHLSCRVGSGQWFRARRHDRQCVGMDDHDLSGPARRGIALLRSIAGGCSTG